MTKIKESKITKQNSWQINYKLSSLQNRTGLAEINCVKAAEYIENKYNINRLEALNYLIDCFFEGKMILTEKNKYDNINTIKKNTKIKNLEDL
jgi:hypothetical protein